MPTDTVMMIGNGGGQMFFVEKKEILKCKAFTLNIKDLEIIEYQWTPILSPDNLLFSKINSGLISKAIRSSINKGVSMIMVSNIICKDRSNNKLSKDFVVFIVH